MPLYLVLPRLSLKTQRELIPEDMEYHKERKIFHSLGRLKDKPSSASTEEAVGLYFSGRTLQKIFTFDFEGKVNIPLLRVFLKRLG